MRYVTRTLCAFPLLLVASFYATWIAGRIALGHWPRPSLDDPKGIAGALMAWFYNLTALLAGLGIPLFGLAILGVTLICVAERPEGWRNRLVEALVALVLFIGFVIFCLWDPHSVLTWYMD
ncbi:MAG TPA: hypothetical protein VNU68_12665 [Verrucomicrobiae bacterium]|jgi:hypothetical protein|nr:hypothetical protein [Verrucomicrobiae bacterium]